MGRRTVLAAGACFVAALLVVALGVSRSSPDAASASDQPTSETKPKTRTVPIERRDLVSHEDVAGDLGYPDPRAIAAPRQGTVTKAPAPGEVIERGGSLITIDDRTLPLFYGDVPLWRPLSAASSDGPDVAQLEENLVALGFASADELTVDEHFDAATQAAVVEWQESIGVTANGVVELGDLTFQPGPVRIKSVETEVGELSNPQGPILQVTGTERLVEVQLDVVDQDLAVEDDAVQVDLGDGRTVSGTVRSVGKVATAPESDQPGGGSDPTITVLVALDDPSSTGNLDEAPVEVQFTTSVAEGVLAVPVQALLALAEGGYAVEVERDGSTVLVGVELGRFADGDVAVTGAVDEGELVVVPR